MLLHHVLLAIFWTVYCVLHSVLADLRVKKWMQQKAGKSFRYYRLFYTLFAAIALAALLLYQFSMTSLLVYRQTLFTNLAGGLVAVTGVVLMIICIQKYFLSLSGLKSLYQETPSAELMIAGIHRYMRHPLYTGTFLAIW
jgi:protein-S-isoprenylcysteine O-methyltransferase Ste14